MKSLYIYRKVLNKQDIVEWAKSQGFTSLLPQDDLHVTVVYCKEKVDWDEVDRDQPKMLLNTDPDDEREVHLFDGGACVLEIFSDDLIARNSELAEFGIKSRYSDYRSHVTLTYKKPDDLKVEDIVPYRGPIIFGPEIFQKIKSGGWTPTDEQSLVDEPVKESLSESHDIDLDHAYDLFRAAGSDWSKDKFLSRAAQWSFSGDLSGYVATKDQADGLRKLIGVAGTPEGVAKGLREISQEGKPIWGMVSNGLAKIAQQYGFVAPHLMRGGEMMSRLLMKLVTALKYDDFGDKKYLIGNRQYFSQICSEPSVADSIAEYPSIAAFMAKLMGSKLDETHRLDEMSGSFSLYNPISDVEYIMTPRGIDHADYVYDNPEKFGLTIDDLRDGQVMLTSGEILNKVIALGWVRTNNYGAWFIQGLDKKLVRMTARHYSELHNSMYNLTVDWGRDVLRPEVSFSLTDWTDINRFIRTGQYKKRTGL